MPLRAPEAEYLYNVTVRRHYNFPNATDALSYATGSATRSPPAKARPK
jgi:hypothetical protein